MANEKRLIDANELSEKIGNMKNEITHSRGGYRYCNEDEKNEWDKLDGFDSLVFEAPTVDAVEVPCKIGDFVWAIRSFHGHKHPQRGIVSDMFFTKDMKLMIVVKYVARGEWGKTVFATDTEAYAAIGVHNCPNCGAKMDGERRTDDG